MSSVTYTQFHHLKIYRMPFGTSAVPIRCGEVQHQMDVQSRVVEYNSIQYKTIDSCFHLFTEDTIYKPIDFRITIEIYDKNNQIINVLCATTTRSFHFQNGKYYENDKLFSYIANNIFN